MKNPIKITFLALAIAFTAASCESKNLLTPATLQKTILLLNLIRP